jgi:integrase
MSAGELKKGAAAGRLGGSEPAHLRTAIAKACSAAAIPLWSPHDLRHRRISFLHLRGVPWARIGEFVGQRNLSVTADTYTRVPTDEAELDYADLFSFDSSTINTTIPVSVAKNDQSSSPPR